MAIPGRQGDIVFHPLKAIDTRKALVLAPAGSMQADMQADRVRDPFQEPHELFGLPPVAVREERKRHRPLNQQLDQALELRI